LTDFVFENGACEKEQEGRIRSQEADIRPRDQDVCFGSKADVTLLNFDVRFTPESGHGSAR
jgi:hypothetical protein